MDFQSNPQSESGRLEQIVSQFYLKSFHIILDSRIPSLRPHNGSGDLSRGSQVRKSDRWFSLVLGDRPAALENLDFWHRNLMGPMIIDIILVHDGSDPSSESSLGASIETVIERWVVQYECPPLIGLQSGDSSSYKKTYQKSIILLRALYSTMRLLPAYRIFRQLSTYSQTYNFDLVYKVSSFCHPFSREEEKLMKEYRFLPVDAIPGRLYISVTYFPTLSGFNLQAGTSFPPDIITDYVGSPATDPARSFCSTEKGVRATSFPLRGIRPSCPTISQRPHSWTSGFQRAALVMTNHRFSGSPAVYSTSPLQKNLSSPSHPDIYNRAQNLALPTHHKGTNFYELSPPFSPSSSPTTPTCNIPNSPMHTRLHSETAPMTIPPPIMSRSFKSLLPNSSDPCRNSLPPLSPRGIRNDPSSQESPSGIRSSRKTDLSRPGELYLGTSNSYICQKVVKDSKDDSGRFSAALSSSGSPRVGFSRSSSRISFRDDLDDGDFSCPFDVDDVDTPGSHPSEHFVGEEASGRFPKSQDAAVGALVHMLRTAPALRQDSSCLSSHSSKAGAGGEAGAASSFFAPRRTADALEELKGYREMKDLLLSKSGTHLANPWP